MLKLLKDDMRKAQDKMKAYANKHKREVEYAVGDVGWLRVLPFHQQSLTKRKFEKLPPHFFGPYKILR